MQYFRRWLRRPLRELSSIDAYALWAQQYPATAHNQLMQIEQTTMLDLMPDLADKVVLDLACGTGRYANIALEHDAEIVIGFDNSAAMLQAAIVPNIAQATTEAIPLASEAVDVVLCGLALGHLPQIEPTLREIRRVLGTGGTALISDFHPFQYLAGAQRTFTAADGTTYAVEHYAHFISKYLMTAQRVGLRLSAIAEPNYNNQPVVLILRLDRW